MIPCQCPKCQKTFQVTDHAVTVHPCPDCRFSVEVPRLDIERSSRLIPGPAKPQVVVECPHCDMKFPEQPGQAGRTVQCPDCRQPVLIPESGQSSDRPKYGILTWIVLALVVLFVALCNISILGPNANKAFDTVGQSIGKTVAS